MNCVYYAHYINTAYAQQFIDKSVHMHSHWTLF